MKGSSFAFMRLVFLRSLLNEIPKRHEKAIPFAESASAIARTNAI